MKDAEYYIKKLVLKRHPEGGWYKEIYRSNEIIKKEHLPERFSGDRYYSTSILYLLESGDFSAFHRIKSDETWHFYDGDTLTIHMINKSGKYSTETLGRSIDSGEVLQFTVPHSTWFAANVSKPGAYALVGCTVSPGFDFDDFEIALRGRLIKEFPRLENIIKRFTRQ